MPGVRLAFAAGAVGCASFAAGQFLDDDVARLLQLNEDELPMLIVSLRGKSIPLRERDTGETVWFGGDVNQLSTETIAYPLLDNIHLATKNKRTDSGGSSVTHPPLPVSARMKLPSGASSTRTLGEVARMRRSALDFLGGELSMSFRSFRPFWPSAANHYWLILGVGVSSSFFSTFIASMDYRPEFTSFYRNVPSWSMRSRAINA